MEGTNKQDKKLNVEIWYDIACPYCYIGERRFAQALKNFIHRDEVNVQFRAFELNPDAPKDTELSMLEEARGNGDAESIMTMKHLHEVKDYAAQDGLDYDIEHIKRVSTHDAHRLAVLADVYGKRAELLETLFHAYFIEAKNVADHQVLTVAAAEVGLPADEVQVVLTSNRYEEEVRQEEEDAWKIQFEYIPAYVVNRQFNINGAKSVGEILQLLENAYEGKAPDADADTDGNACGIHGCN
uniref:DsbA family oxidoreductase n=2 Tax=unclassified Prevotella TaxID=2638335 RepID=A0AB33JQF2_9BACT